MNFSKDEQFMEKYIFGEELSVRVNKPGEYDQVNFERPETYMDISPCFNGEF